MSVPGDVGRPPDRARVLITGSAGTIGTVLKRELADRYDLTGVDLNEVPGPGKHCGDITDQGVLEGVLSGGETVVHLAATSSSVRIDTGYLGRQFVMTKTLYEAALRQGVKRVIFASSNQVTGGYEMCAPYSAIVKGDYGGLEPSDIPLITIGLPPHPRTAYAVGKVWGEAAGRRYSAKYGLSVICLRIGTFKVDSRPTHVRQLATLLTPPDLVQLVSRCVDAPESVRYAVFYGVSDNTWRFWEISDAERLVGYRPRDNAEHFRTSPRHHS